MNSIGDQTALDGPDADPTADFEAFFRREAHGQVQRAALLLGSVEDANDVVQEALTRIYKRWTEIAEPGPYLNTTVLNLCRDFGRRKATRTRLAHKLKVLDDSTSPGEVLDDIIGALPFNQRAAVVLRYWAQLSTAEIATELGCAPGSVGPWINRAEKQIRKALS